MMNQTARSFTRMIAAAAMLVMPAVASAQTTYTSFASFTAALSVEGTDSFDDLTGFYDIGPITRTAGVKSYSVKAAAFPFDVLLGVVNPSNAADTWLSTEEATAPLVFSGFSSDVFGFGGRFFATNLAGSVTGTKLFISAVDVLGNTLSISITPVSANDFFGVMFSNALASFTVTADNSAFAGAANFVTANDVVLGGARTVPEPSTVSLVISGLTILMLAAYRRQHQG